jgi:hypothetical protein
MAEEPTVLYGSEDCRGTSYGILQWFHSNSVTTAFDKLIIFHPSYTSFGRTKVLFAQKNEDISAV